MATCKRLLIGFIVIVIMLIGFGTNLAAPLGWGLLTGIPIIMWNALEKLKQF